MGRFKAGVSAEAQAKYHEASDAMWLTALKLVLDEHRHKQSCTDPECGGVIFPWLKANLEKRDAAILFCATVLERLADGITDRSALVPGFPGLDISADDRPAAPRS